MHSSCAHTQIIESLRKRKFAFKCLFISKCLSLAAMSSPCQAAWENEILPLLAATFGQVSLIYEISPLLQIESGTADNRTAHEHVEQLAISSPRSSSKRLAPRLFCTYGIAGLFASITSADCSVSLDTWHRAVRRGGSSVLEEIPVAIALLEQLPREPSLSRRCTRRIVLLVLDGRFPFYLCEYIKNACSRSMGESQEFWHPPSIYCALCSAWDPCINHASSKAMCFFSFRFLCGLGAISP